MAVAKNVQSTTTSENKIPLKKLIKKILLQSSLFIILIGWVYFGPNYIITQIYKLFFKLRDSINEIAQIVLYWGTHNFRFVGSRFINTGFVVYKLYRKP